MPIRRRDLVGGLVLSPLVAKMALSQTMPVTEASWAQTVADAKKEGVLQVYSVSATPPVVAVVKAFEKASGLRTEFLSVAKPNELREKVRVEQSSGRFIGDVMITTVAQTTVISAEDKTIAPLPQVPNAANVRRELQTVQPILPMALQLSGFMINTSLIKPEEAPQSWQDLLNPKWKGQILMDDPRSIGGGYLMFYALYDKLGREFTEKLAEQQPQLTNEPREAIRRVARGEKAILMPVVLADTLEVKGLPIKAVVPKEGALYNQQGTTVLKNAPHPNAAKLFLNFVLSEEAQTIFANAGSGITSGDAGKIARPEVKEFVTAKLFGTIDPLRQTEMLANARAIFK
jgi:iron(III) transport system substrate-binding protein